MDDREIDKLLTGRWSQSTPRGALLTVLDITSDGGRVGGVLYSRNVRRWHGITGSVFVEGRRNGRFLDLQVYDWISGVRTKLAETKVRFQLEDEGAISDRQPPLVESSLDVEFLWQIVPTFPDHLILARDERSMDPAPDLNVIRDWVRAHRNAASAPASSVQEGSRQASAASR